MTTARHQLILRSLYRALGGPASEVGDAELLRRFTTARDETAFELLLWRHGAMVLRVCGQVLRNPHDAEDAFQATFLVLARKAGTLGKGEALPGWLYRVALRIARRASREGARRTSRQQPFDLAALAEPSSGRDEAAVLETNRLLHEEVNRLPAKYRLPIVLCYLESRTHEEAARLLGWARGTVAGRLSRARDLLRRRLVRRDLSLASGLLVVELLAAAAPAAVPAALMVSTVRAAAAFAAGKATAAAALTRAAVWAEGVLRAMFWMKVKMATVVVLLVGLIGSGTALFTRSALAQQPEAPAPAPATVRADEVGGSLAKQDADEDRDAARDLALRQAQSRVNLKNIAQAMNAYQRKHGYYPAPALYNGVGPAQGPSGMGPAAGTPGGPGGGAGAVPGLSNLPVMGRLFDPGARPKMQGQDPVSPTMPPSQVPQNPPPVSPPGQTGSPPGMGPMAPGGAPAPAGGGSMPPGGAPAASGSTPPPGVQVEPASGRSSGPRPRTFPFPGGPYVPSGPGTPPGMNPVGLPGGGGMPPGGMMPPGMPGGVGVPGMPGGGPGRATRQGKALLSWRVALLPFLGEEKLYQKFKLNEPWDSPHNKKLLPLMPKVYAPPSGRHPGHVTFYQVFVGPGAAFEKHRQLQPSDFLDGTANTLLVVEAGAPVPWTKPEDLHYAADEPIPELGGLFPGRFNAAVVEGSVATYSTHADPRLLRAAITRAGGEPLDLNRLRVASNRREAALRTQNEQLRLELERQQQQLDDLRRERELLKELDEDDNSRSLRQENEQLKKKLHQSRAEAERLKEEIRRMKRTGQKEPPSP